MLVGQVHIPEAALLLVPFPLKLVARCMNGIVQTDRRLGDDMLILQGAFLA